MFDLSSYKRIVIKIGSALIIDNKGNVRTKWLETLADDVARLRKDYDMEIIIVTSGSIAVGCKYLNIHRKSLKIAEKQAVASYGQTYLIKHFQDAFAKAKQNISQILVTIDDSENRRRYLNANNTINKLLEMDIVPVINENDTVATKEIRFSDNDRLAARIAQMTSSNLLVLLSDIDGMYTANPKLDKSATMLHEVDEITDEILAMAGDSISDVGTGGMYSKLIAGQIALASGSDMIITKGEYDNPLTKLNQDKIATLFKSKSDPISARKKWIMCLEVSGKIIIDNGAKKALGKGNSLLAVGIKRITGKFSKGDSVLIKSLDGELIARGLINYDFDEAEKLKGQSSSSIQQILGYDGQDEIIHRDNMVLADI
jgi:glutamate 5-kinase